ncbi:hypothetical protein [Fibrobacter sp. UBA4297]|uniref:hypothetical protein n=1 Tax=Fibrobacter sp. UBA4297 TaxID=1946536 RepID=UPI0025BB4A1E|nr:hypothetical protein [Fibrobacter sp. UBA4297]
MNIRKHWKNLLLTTTAFFWAGCNGDSVTESGCPCDNGSGIESSSDNNDESSSSNAPSSSNAVESSSSEDLTSSSAGTSSELSSSSSFEASSSSTGEVTCVPGDSVISYFATQYSADLARFNAEEKAKHASVSKIDSISNTLQTVPQCLANLRQELDMFVALYGAPNNITKDEVCSDGTSRPTQEYLNYLKMKEEWEKNKPALDAECQKIFEDKLKEIEQTVKECLAISDPNTDLTVCDFDAMCPEYGVDSKCTYKYTCNDGVTCRRTEGNTNMDCTDKQGEKFTNTKKDFDKKYYTKENY